jgi:hypothetical protein
MRAKKASAFWRNRRCRSKPTSPSASIWDSTVQQQGVPEAVQAGVGVDEPLVALGH